MVSFAAVAALAFLPLAAGLHEEACEPAQMPKQGSTMLQTVSKDEAAHNSSYNTSSRFSTSTEYCNQNDEFSRTTGCWDRKPATATAPCTPSSGTQVCKCPDTLCAIDHLDRTPKATGRCREKKVYVAGGETHTSGGVTGVTGTSEEAYCFDMVKNDQWEQRGLVRTGSNRRESKTKPWWGCHPFWHWVHRDGKCRDRTRYLGESCWSGGKCKGHDTSYDEYSTSCYNGKCVPYAWVEQRNECRCAWVWNFGFVCTAQDGACGGHPCVFSTGGGGKYYCDYAASANWR